MHRAADAAVPVVRAAYPRPLLSGEPRSDRVCQPDCLVVDGARDDDRPAQLPAGDESPEGAIVAVVVVVAGEPVVAERALEQGHGMHPRKLRGGSGHHASAERVPGQVQPHIRSGAGDRDGEGRTPVSPTFCARSFIV